MTVRRTVGGVALAVLVLAVLTARTAATARADGAFPNSQSILLPRDRPHQIVVGATFGLIFSEDDGVNWRFACENDATLMPMGGQYVIGAPPDDRIFARSDVRVSVSTDDACTWTIGGGDLLPPLMPFDVFADPSDPMRVFVLADDPDEGLVSAYRSVDAGATYLGPIFKSPAGAVVTGIESARSASQTVYLTLYQGPGVHPVLAASDDGGDTFTMTDIEMGIGAVVPYLAAVDPTDARKLYLRITSGPGDPQIFQGLAITTDAGKTWSIPLKVMNGSLVGFARLSDGNLFLVGTTAPAASGESSVPAAFRSDDGGRTFTTEMVSFHPIGLAERNGTLFVATNNFLDGVGLVSTDDGGRSWQPRLRFQDIAGMKDCVRSTCQQSCDFLAGLKLFPPQVCNPLPDAGVADATVEPNSGGGGGGCGCDLAAQTGRSLGLTAALLLFGRLGLARRRRPDGP